ncbi:MULTISPECIES: hypothetical protein [Acetobacter]|uniref:Uncharacterized protein n=2 Tax=Acetobacter TaxID=434 RepID=A0A1Y0V902_9PROT|nr:MULTISPECIES: hypothetical protein [Acetobacter]ARW12148.1 hypothetical protein S101447_03111 [Acetobacter ascendens]ARW49363.1 hypothetical protein S1001342_03073 [Acetobacter pasteurianus subsp. pasteurianus]GCD57122.1 hypothetical protein NBRC3222_2459 [Acetobacter pasteurianus NBRC 3222]
MESQRDVATQVFYDPYVSPPSTDRMQRAEEADPIEKALKAGELEYTP